jgi:signal transduction histidine kinase
MFWLHYITTYGIYLIIWITSLHFALVFPHPHKLIERRRWLVPLIYSLPFAVHLITAAATRMVSASTLDWLGRIGLDQNLTVMIYLLSGLLAVVTNYRSQPDAVSRQQIRVVVYALGLIIVIAVLLWQVPQIVFGEQVFTSSMMAVVGLLLPLALAVSILRYRLWDIDVIINRTAVYGLLTILIAGLYVAIVGIFGAMFQQRGTLLFSLIATGLVAVIFQPLRERLQRAVNRLMYGERDDPYHVISRLGRQLQSTTVPEDLLETISQTLATALKLPYASIALLEGGAFKMQAEYGIPPKEPFILPLIYQKEIVGQLAVAPRSQNEPFTPPDMRLLEDIARQAGGAAHTVRLNRDLRRSREKLVATREEERRRIRRDLHDGIGPTLASHTLKLDAILDLIDTDCETAKVQIEELKGQTQDTIADIRRLVYELRPPALDELGLVEALEAHIYQVVNTPGGPEITLNVKPPGLPPLSAAVEVAAYRITLEALTNIIRHAQAQTCNIRFAVGDLNTLQLEIIDDGVGLPTNLMPGVGISSMRERAVELGGVCILDKAPSGGTRITVVLPLAGLEN